eukprot:TRINITY_DN16602_c0_g1_i1.p1 TRINITY_DN16602_c0_g1~~TRINITY_DN16602_c0_g1_i1.p1  ORF type:complete len:664 (+),score=262.31 TRINITY_DN16602_c0_g1_i1:74-2065(+)
MKVTTKTHFHGGKPRHLAVHPTQPLLAVVLKHEPWVMVYDYEAMRVETRIEMSARDGENCFKYGEIKKLEWVDMDNAHISQAGSMRGMAFREHVEARKAAATPLWANQTHTEYIAVTFERVLVLVPINKFETRRYYRTASRDNLFSCHANAALKDDEYIRTSAMLHSLPFAVVGSTAGKLTLWGFRSKTFHAQAAVKGLGGPTCMAVAHPTPRDVTSGTGLLFVGWQSGNVTMYNFATDLATGVPALQGGVKWQVKAFADGPVVALQTTAAPPGTDPVVHASASSGIVQFTASGRQLEKVKLGKKHILGCSHAVYPPAKDPSGRRVAKYIVANEYNKVYLADAGLGDRQELPVVVNLKTQATKDDVHIYCVAGAWEGRPEGGFWIASNHGLAQCTFDAADPAEGTVFKSGAKKIYATLVGGNTLTVFHGADRGQHTVVCQKQMAAKQLFGGKWLGIAGGTYNAVQFFDWCDLTPVATGLNIPAPKLLEWAEVSGLCVIVYTDAVYLLEAVGGTLDYYSLLNVRGVESCLWAFRGRVLFLTDGVDIVAVFPYKNGHDRALVATAATGEHYAALATLEEGAAGEAGLAAAPSELAPRHCVLEAVTAAGLEVSAGGATHTLPLPPTAQWMALAQMGEEEAAMKWVEAGVVNAAVVQAFLERRAEAM